MKNKRFFCEIDHTHVRYRYFSVNEITLLYVYYYIIVVYRFVTPCSVSCSAVVVSGCSFIFFSHAIHTRRTRATTIETLVKRFACSISHSSLYVRIHTHRVQREVKHSVPSALVSGLSSACTYPAGVCIISFVCKYRIEGMYREEKKQQIGKKEEKIEKRYMYNIPLISRLVLYGSLDTDNECNNTSQRLSIVV